MPKPNSIDMAKFVYRRGIRGLDGYRITDTGDCNDFVVWVLHKTAGNVPRMLWWLLIGKAAICTALSKHPTKNRLRRIPTHTILWSKGAGYVDSTVLTWRDDPAPHKVLIRWRWLGAVWPIFMLLWGATFGRVIEAATQIEWRK